MAAKHLSREESKELTRKRLLEAGRRVFADRGVQSTQIRDVIGIAGVAIGTFYLHFRSKDELFEAVMNESTRELRDRLRAVRKNEDLDVTVEQRAEGACRAFCEFVVAEKDLFRILFREGLLGAGPPDGIAHAFVTALTVDLREDLDWALEREIVSPSDFDLLAPGIIGLGVAIGFQLVEQSDPDIEGTSRFMARMVLGAIAATTTGSQPRCS